MIEFVGGLLCFPVIVPPGLPAQIVPYGIWLFAVAKLISLTIRALKRRRQILMPFGALVISLASMWFFFTRNQPMSGFLWGMKTRFAYVTGYEAMREFANEVAQKPEGIIDDPAKPDPRYNEDQRVRKALAARYPFLDWGFGGGDVCMRDDIVSLLWGSSLAGHWGFQVATDGMVKDLTEPDPGTFLRVSDDMQFVYYKD
jgi:hypothetical protein